MNTFSKNKIFAIAIILLLTISTAGAIAIANAANAYPTNVVTHTTFMFCSVGSNVLGVGQTQLLVYWTADIPPDIGETDGLISGSFNRATWTGVTFNVTSPSGVSTIVEVPAAQQDSIGGGYVAFTPNETGRFTVQAIFPAQWKNSTLIQAANGTFVSTLHQFGFPTPTSQLYTADTSSVVTFDVQTAPIAAWTESPLPNDYWTRPINDASRLWSQLGGSWLAGAWQQPAGQAGGTTTRYVYGVGTETNHIMWTRSMYLGGYMDARFPETGYQTGHYQGLEFTAIIMNGKIYYADRADAYTQAASATGINVVDLYTGELLGYYNNTIMPAYGQIYNYESPNQHGGFSMLWRTTGVTLPAGYTSGTGTSSLEMLDGYSLPLRHICYIANASTTGTNVVGNNGELLWYNLVNYGTAATPNYYLTCWNNTNVLGETATGPNTGTTYWQWRPEGGGFGGGPVYNNSLVFDGRTGFSVNASIPNPMGPGPLNQNGTILTVRVGDQDGKGGMVIIGTLGQNNELGNIKGQLWALSLQRGQEGKQLWTTQYTAPYLPLADNETTGMFGTYSMVGVFPEDNAIIFHSSKQLKYWAIDMTTGNALWETAREPDQNYYSTQTNYYNHMLLTTGYGGVCIAYDMANGKQLWNYTATNIGGESPYGNYPLNIFAICDGKLYLLTGEHSVGQPMWRGPNIRCINATNGAEIWAILGMGADNGAHLTGQYMELADGKVVGLNYFDNQIYCFGPGPSQTTVSAPQVVPTVGSSVMISGTVTDNTQSGRRNVNQLYDFKLAGTPAISDKDMEAWMEYLYMDQAKPTNATGVTVTLTAVDPNGNMVPVGTTTSDMNGNYAIKYTPAVSGDYQILASFAGSKAYGPSSATTYLSIAENTVTNTPAPTATPQSTADMYLIPATIGIIIAIAIATVVIVLALRKRP